jgi:hypothetical protein
MLRLLQWFASTLQAMTVFELGFFRVILTQGLSLRSLTSNLN